ncbi:MAG TPA: hypothetical protein VFS08_18355 [Gemmatimonadaceae bacterium]|nr:hypothetical protein [Gemmatimonadaceae bacterium]
MSAITVPARALVLVALLASRAGAQGLPHQATTHEQLGTVHVPTSCRAEVAPTFDRAVALLHSFEFGAAIRTFDQVLATDSTCAMAYWGIALSRWTNPMSADNRSPVLLAQGRRASAAATRLAAGATARERGYVAAVSRLYDDYEHVDQPARVAGYERAMADLVARQPADTEARIFHAIALVASAPPGDKSYARQRQAGATLESLWVAQPDHPGLAHYIIHSYDVPALAPLAARAAERYAEIAPDAAHALHMPSHTFTRVGMWEASVETNRRSIAAATRDASTAEVLHASDYLVYASLQMRRDSAVRTVLAGLPAIAAHFDPTAVTGAAPGSAGVYALAAMPARYALERRAWSEAASLVPAASAFPYAEAVTYLARALGSAHLGRLVAAREAVDSLAAIHARLLARQEPYWAEQVAIQQLGARAWLALAEGRQADALALMREAAGREDATEKSAVTPGPLAPARELLGDMLLALDRPAEALAEYRHTLAGEPRRYRSLLGAWRAATAVGDRAAAAGYAAELRALTGSMPADTTR